MQKNESTKLQIDSIQMNLGLGVLLYRTRKVFLYIFILTLTLGSIGYKFLPIKSEFTIYLSHNKMVLDALDAYVMSFSSVTTGSAIVSSSEADYKARRIVSELDIRSNFKLLSDIYESFPENIKEKYSRDYFYNFFSNNVSVEYVGGQWVHNFSSSDNEFISILGAKITSSIQKFYSKAVDDYIISNTSFYEKFIKNFLDQKNTFENIKSRGNEDTPNAVNPYMTERMLESELEANKLRAVLKINEKPTGSVVSQFITPITSAPPVPFYLAIIILIFLSILVWIFSSLSSAYIKEISELDKKL